VERIEQLTRLKFGDAVRAADVARQTGIKDKEIRWFNEIRLR
jgi:hypothetical protein